ncbi:sigma-70 family RNA polymerase sigma factor [Pseudorhodoferax sp.]|uniref:sigma-70 family RNA polymerase sigma factor n=1 Tax=Pseudorhodoferax sp. TaxID=1993553 RepID=UPI002DD61B9E|nr:sigma-70 family RNA polymerase sigma factor [Pseudorhodoferax sp.]
MDLQPHAPATPDPAGAGLRAAHLSVVPRPGPRTAAPGPEELAGWVRAVAEAGDRQAFAALFGHFAPRIKSYLLRAGADEALAEDLAQETLVTLWRKAAQFDAAQAGVATWVFTIARNLRVDRFRRQGGASALQVDDMDMDALAHGAPEPAAQLHAARMERQVRSALRQLPPEQVQVLQLSYYEDQPHARIAAELGIPLGTVKSRVRLAVAHLRRLLAAFEDPAP